MWELCNFVPIGLTRSVGPKILTRNVYREGISEDGDASTILTYIAALVSVAQFDALGMDHL